MITIKVPTIDVNEEACNIADVYFENGESVEKDDVLLVVETTKATEDILAPEAGIIHYQVKKEEKVPFGNEICLVFSNQEEYQDFLQNKSSEEKLNISSDFTLTKKAQEYIKKNNIDFETIKKSFNKKVLKVDDIKSIINQDQSKTTSHLSKPLINNRKKIVIIGAGAGGEVVADILLDYPEYEVIGFVDDNPREDFQFYGIQVIHNNIKNFPFEFKGEYDAVIISFTRNLNLRKEIFELYQKEGISFVNAIDKSVKIGRNTKIGEGNIIGAFCYIGTSTIINDNNWIGACVNIDHHNVLGSHNLIGPNFTAPGIVSIGDLNKVGANASLGNYVQIGNENIILNNKSVVSNLTDKQIIK